MPSYEYKGHEFESDHELTEAEWKQTLAYFDAQPAPKKKESKSLLDKFKTEAEGLGSSAKSALYDTSRNLALGTVGLPSLGVDKLVQAVTGDADYANPVTKYVGGLVEGSEQAQQAAQADAKASDIGGAGSVVGGVIGKIPEMFMGGMGSAGMKTVEPVAGAILPAIQQMAQKGFAAAQPMAVSAGLGKYDEALEKGHTGVEATAAGLGGYGNMAMQGTLPMGMAGNVGKRIVTGAGVNVPAGIAGRQLENLSSPKDMQQDLYDPKAMLTDALMGSTMHGVMGERAPVKQESAKSGPKGSGDVETQLIQASRERSISDRQSAVDLITKLAEDGDMSPEIMKVIEGLDAEIKHHDEAIKRADAIIGGKNPDAAADKNVEDMQRQYDRMAANQKPPKPDQRAGLDEEIPLEAYGNEPPQRSREIDPETGEILSRPQKEADVVKTSPMEMALTKLGEAMNEPKEKVEARLQKARDALDTLPKEEFRDDTPGSHYSALKEALEHEIQGYESIIRGEAPKLEAETPLPIINDVGVVKHGTWESPEDAAARARTEEAKNTPDSVEKRDESQARANEERRQWREWGEDRGADTGMSPAQARQTSKFELNKLEQLEKNIRNQIEQDAQGLLPSGSLDHGRLQASLESIGKQRAKWEKIQAWAEERIAKTGTKEEKFAVVEEKTRPEETKYDSMEDITKATGDDVVAAVKAIDSNLHLVNNPKGTKIFFDKNINPKVQKILTHLLEITKFGKEKIIFVNSDTLAPAGRVMHTGNTTYIRLKPAALEKNLTRLADSKFFNKLTGGKLAEAVEHLNTVRYAAHELGHAMLNKYLRDSITHTDDLTALSKDWEKYNKENNHGANTIFDLGLEKDRAEYQKAFHEFFAEKVAKELIHKHVFNAFDKRSQKFISEIHKVIEASHKYLKDLYGYSEDPKNFSDQILNDILNSSQEYIAQTSKQAAERVKVIGNDKLILGEKAADRDAFPFYKKTMEDVRGTLDALDGMVSDPTIKLDDIKDPMHTPISARSIISSGAGMVARNFFGKLGLAKVLRDNPVIQRVNAHIRNAERIADEVSNRLWFGEIQRGDWNKANPIAKMKKIKTETSAYMQMKFSSHVDAAVVHDLFKKGFEEGKNYADNLAANGQHLTVQQLKLYNALAKMFTGQYDESVKVQTDLGKKNILPHRDGWYPAVRAGQYYIDVSFAGNTVHRQHFRSATEAALFKRKLESTGIQHLDISEPLKKGDDNTVSDMFRTIELVNSIIKQHYPNASPHIAKRIDDALQKVVQRGGKLGGHHKHRSNLSGYMGDELFMSQKEKGESFKKAIQQSVDDYSGGIRKMIIQHHTDPILEKLQSQNLDENTLLSAKQMVESSLNRVENNFEKFDDGLRNVWDKALLNLTGEIKANGAYGFDNFSNKSLEFFYVMKLMPKLAFSFGQLLSLGGAVREMSYDGGLLRPYWSGGKALTKLLSGDKELRDTIFEVSQEANTFEPKFIEALHLSGSEGGIWNFMKDYLFLGKLNEGIDSFTRMMTFASNYEMYKDLGFGKTEARRRAMENTDSTMVTYGRTETAPIFSKTGIIGTAAKPLQTYGAAQLANVVSDLRHMQAKDPKTWAPFVNYMMMSTLMGGVVSVAFVQEYEMLRGWLNKTFPDFFKLPSVMDMMSMDMSFLDRVITTDAETKDAIKVAATYGVPALSGLDIASSARTNETFISVVAATLLGQKAWYELTPMLEAVGKAGAGAVGIAGAAFGDKTNASMRKAMTDALPVGHMGYGAKELAGVNTTEVAGQDYINPETGERMVAGGKENSAIVPQGTMEKVAGYLGTKSMRERRVTDATRLGQEEEQILKDRQKGLIEKFHDTGNKKYLGELAKTGMSDQEIEAGVKSGEWKRIAPADLRYFVNAKGDTPSTPEGARKAKRIFNFGLIKPQKTQ